MAYVLIWVAFGVISMIVAKGKGRDGCAWFAIGVLAGPFALIASLVVSDNVAAVEQRELAEGVSKKCPMCAELVKAEAIKCRYCGADLSVVPEPVKVQADTEPVQVEGRSSGSSGGGNYTVLFITAIGVLVIVAIIAVVAKK